MSIENIFEENRSQSIESLEFCFFLREIYFSLLKDNNRKNNQIQEFIDVIGKNYYYQSFKIQNYVTSLKDYVFWQSGDIYLENMKKFVSHECSASDFACTVYFLIQNNIQEYKFLIKDFEKQSTLELNPKIFQFSKTISDFEFVLEDFIPEPTTDLTEDELREIVKKVLPKVQQYFTDEI
jgi:hypothetical protein